MPDAAAGEDLEPTVTYRPEIDGLRAIAVISVILFHAGLDAFSGGFAGVDVFFVISGYLITTKVLDDLREGRFRITEFYARRARRILPALYIVVLASLPAAWFLLVPVEMADFMASVAAVATFWSNVFFFIQSDYFAPAAELQPLLHTWSLAIEEQYYFIFPGLFVLSIRYKAGVVVGVLAALFAVSLVAAQWAAYRYPEAGFFLLPTRAWELLTGVLAALYLNSDPARAGARTGTAVSLAGLMMVAAPIVLYDPSVPFPSIYALAPTLGTAMIILFAHPGTATREILSMRWLVGLGLISYSLYLWHNPLFAFTRSYYGAGLPFPTTAALIGITLILSVLSWRFVEVPFRRRSVVSTRHLVVMASLCSAVLLGAGVTGVIFEGWPSRVTMPPNVVWWSLGDRRDQVGRVCDPVPLDGNVGEACTFGSAEGTRTIALTGDSHADAISYALDDALKKRGIRGLWVSLEDCQPNPFIVRTGRAVDATCGDRFRKLMGYASQGANALVVVNRWTFRLYPVTGEIDTLAFNNEEGCVELEKHRGYVAIGEDGSTGEPGNADQKRRAVEKFISGLPSDIPVVLVMPIPEFGCDIAKMNFQQYRRTGEVPSELSSSRAVYEKRNAFFTRVVGDALVRNVPNATRRVDPSDLFCDTREEGRCMAQVDGVPLYLDDDHLSDAGAALVVEAIFDTLGIE